MANIFQSEALMNFLYPFLLMFFIVFAVLEKTKVLGDDNKQLNALVSLVIGLIFVGAIFPRVMVQNLILFLTVGLVVIFVGLMLWGFISGGEGKIGGKLTKFFAVIITVSMVIAVLWASGVGGAVLGVLQKIFSFLFASSWSGTFWGNVLIVVIVGGVIAVVLKSGGAAKGKSSS